MESENLLVANDLPRWYELSLAGGRNGSDVLLIRIHPSIHRAVLDELRTKAEQVDAPCLEEFIAPSSSSAWGFGGCMTHNNDFDGWGVVRCSLPPEPHDLTKTIELNARAASLCMLFSTLNSKRCASTEHDKHQLMAISLGTEPWSAEETILYVSPSLNAWAQTFPVDFHPLETILRRTYSNFHPSLPSDPAYFRIRLESNGKLGIHCMFKCLEDNQDTSGWYALRCPTEMNPYLPLTFCWTAAAMHDQARNRGF